MSAVVHSFLCLLLLCGSWGAQANSDVTVHVKEITSLPCSRCHKAFSTNPAVMPLKKPHDGLVLKHMADGNHCTYCHNRSHPDSLTLLEGGVVDYTDLHQVCGQCHGKKLREWNAGLHGRQTGRWNGSKIRSSCIDCHDAHNPKFQPMTAIKRRKQP